MRDVWTVVTKEWKELTASDGGLWVNLTTLAVFLTIVGILLPWQLGPLWVYAPWVVGTWAWISFFLVTTVTADSVAGERERNTLETLLATRLSDASILTGKLLAVVIGVWLATLLCIPMGLITVNLLADGGPHLFSPGHLAAIALLILAATTFGGAFGVLVSIRAPSVRQAQQTLAIGALALFAIPVVIVRLLPGSWTAELVHLFTVGPPETLALTLSAVLWSLTVLLLVPAFRRFKRRRLPLR